MGDNVFVNKDRTAVVDATEPGKKFQMRRKEAVRLGLLPEGDPVPQARRNAPADVSRPIGEPREDTARSFTTTGPVPEVKGTTPAPRRTVRK